MDQWPWHAMWWGEWVMIIWHDADIMWCRKGSTVTANTPPSMIDQPQRSIPQKLVKSEKNQSWAALPMAWYYQHLCIVIIMPHLLKLAKKKTLQVGDVKQQTLLLPLASSRQSNWHLGQAPETQWGSVRSGMWVKSGNRSPLDWKWLCIWPCCCL